MAEELERRLPQAPEAASMARASLRELAHNRLSHERLEDAQLLVTELVTNAIRHAPSLADGTVRLRVQEGDDTLRVIVEDGGKSFAFETATFDNMTGTTHLGLQLVDQLSDGWGLSLDGKKAVWFEIALR